MNDPAVIQTGMRCVTAVICSAIIIGGIRWIVASVVSDLESVSVEGGKHGQVTVRKKK